jgi:Domain of unknown function (DUF4382)
MTSAETRGKNSEEFVGYMKAFGLAMALLLATATCGDSNGVDTGDGVVHTFLTDAPFPYDRIARVDLYVVNVSASLTPDTGSTGNFITLASPNRRINVLALQNGLTEQLGQVTLPNGAITAVRMVIDTDSTSITLRNGAVLTGRSTPGIQWQSSAGRPVLNALIHEQIRVPRSGASVIIDFDIGKAFIPPQEVDPASRDSGFIFSPVLRAADVARTGSITGIVRARTVNGTAVPNASLRLYLARPGSPENTWPVLATTKTDAIGAFKFAFVTQTSYWDILSSQRGGKYVVAVDPPSGSGLGRKLTAELSVTARSETGTGTIILP